MHGYGAAMSREAFARLVGDGRADLPLDEAALAIAGALRGPLDEVEWLAVLDQIAADCATPTAEGIARHLVDRLAFEGNERSYYDWRNSCLDHVLAVRTGIPITLAVVMIEVGRRLGVRLVGVGMPSHFLVGVPGEDRFFDLFNGSAPLDAAGAREQFESVTGGRAPWDDAFLHATSDRQIVIRMLNNLRSIFVGNHDELRLAILMQLRAALPELQSRETTEIATATAILN